MATETLQRKIDGPQVVRRALATEFRATPDEGEGTFTALISPYGTAYDIGYGWQERILAGCFDASIAENPILPIFLQHDWDKGPIGSGEASSSGVGVLVRGLLYLDLDPLVQRVYRAMLDKALREWSAGFIPSSIIWTADEPEVDQIETATLLEASVVVRGAAPTGTLDLRSRKVWIPGDTKDLVTRFRSQVATLEPPAAEADADPVGVAQAALAEAQAKLAAARAAKDEAGAPPATEPAAAAPADESPEAKLAAAQALLAEAQAAVDALQPAPEPDAVDTDVLWDLLDTQGGREALDTFLSSPSGTSSPVADPSPEEDSSHGA